MSLTCGVCASNLWRPLHQDGQVSQQRCQVGRAGSPARVHLKAGWCHERDGAAGFAAEAIHCADLTRPDLAGIRVQWRLRGGSA